MYIISASLLFLIIILLLKNKSIIGDETVTLNYALNYSFLDILHEKYKGDFNPFLFFILTKLTFLLFKTDWSLRLVSIFGYFLSIYVYSLILSHFNYSKYQKWTGFSIFSTMPILIQYSIFARPYTLLLLISLLIIYTFIREAKQSNIVNYICYILTLSIGFYIHFFTALFVFIFSTSVYIFYYSRITFTIMRNFVISNFIVFIAILPEINSLFIKVKTISNIQQDISLQPFYKKLAFLIYSLIFAETQVPSIISSILFVLLIIFIILINKNIINNISKINLERTRIILFSTFFIILSCLVITVTGFPRPMYIIFTIPFISIIINDSITHSVGFTKYIFIIIILFIFTIPTYNNLTNNTSQFVSPQYGIDYKKIIPNIERLVKPNTVFIISPSFNKPIFQLYSQKGKDENYIYFNPFEPAQYQIEQLKKYYNRNLIFINEHHNENNVYLLKKDLFQKFQIKENVIELKHKSYTKNKIYNYFEVINYQN